MREVEVAVGLVDGTWYSEWVKIEDDGIYLDETLSAIAEQQATERAAKKDKSVSFVQTIYIQAPEDLGHW